MYTEEDRALEARLDRQWEKGQRFIQAFRRTLPSGSKLARSIDRGDYWSEIATWARREGYDDFATAVDLMILDYNARVPDFQEH